MQHITIYPTGRLNTNHKHTTKMSSNFYNTISESGSELAASNEKARTQEQEVLRIFREYQKYAISQGVPPHLTASQVWQWMKVNNSNALLTSVRRAMSNLVNQEKLYRTDMLRMGKYGKREHLYKLLP